MRLRCSALLALCCILTVKSEELSTNALQAIHVTADRPQRLDTSTPADTTFISSNDIERSQAASVPELLAREANILFRSSTGKSSEGQVAMRGFGDNSGLRVLVEVDGQKFNRPDMGSIDWNQIPIGDISHIEVIRGGNNVLYGNHALAGVIKITTKKGGEPRLYLRGVGGSDEFEQYAALATGGAGNWYADAGIDYLRDPGYRTNSLSWSQTAHGSLGYFVGDIGSLTLRASQGESRMQLPGPLTYEQMKEDPSQSSNPGDQDSRSDNGLYTLLWEGEHNWGKTKLGAGYNFRDMEWGLSGIYANNDQEGFSLTPRIQIGPDQDHLIFGWDFFYDQVDFETYSSPTSTLQNSEAELERITTGPYIFAQREIIEQWTLSGGARYETARTKNRYVKYKDQLVAFNKSEPFIQTNRGPIPNPNYHPDFRNVRIIDDEESFDGTITKSGWAAELSLMWQPHKNLSVWTGYDRVYRYPTLDEAASYQGYPLSDPLNENLEPEEGNNFEAGLKYDDGSFLLSLTGFFMELENEIAFDNELNLNVNMGRTRRYGAEIESGYSTDLYGLSARCSFVDARFADGPNKGKEIPLVPQAYGTVSAWIQPVQFLRLTTHYSHVASQYQGNDEINGERKLAGYGLVGARIDVMPTERINLFVKGENLLDELYASSAYNGAYYPGMGRSFQIGLTLEF